MSNFLNAKSLCIFCLMWQNNIHGFVWVDQDWIKFNFCGSGLGSDWKILQSGCLWSIHGINQRSTLAGFYDFLSDPVSSDIWLHAMCEKGWLWFRVWYLTEVDRVWFFWLHILSNSKTFCSASVLPLQIIEILKPAYTLTPQNCKVYSNI